MRERWMCWIVGLSLLFSSVGAMAQSDRLETAPKRLDSKPGWTLLTVVEESKTGDGGGVDKSSFTPARWGKSGYVVYVDTSSFTLTSLGGSIKWLIDRKTPKKFGEEEVLSEVYWDEFDCQARKSHMAGLWAYTEHMGNGRSLIKFTPEPNAWSDISSKSDSEIFKLVCERAAQADRLDEARRYLVRGSAAMEIAKSQEDFSAAAREFRTAAQLAPGLAAAWFNLGVVEAKLNRYAEAGDAYRRYLQLAPKAEDVAKIGNEIIKLEYLQEQLQAQARLAGNWAVQADPSGATASDAYQIRFENAKFVMTPSSRSWLGREISLFTDKREPDRKNSFKAGGAQLMFVGRIVGDRIVGERIQPETVISFDEEQPLCRLREHRGKFEGRLESDGTSLSISFSEPRYSVYWSYIGSFLALGTSKSCRAVDEGAAENVVLRLTRQQPASISADRPASGGERNRSARDYLVRGAIALEAAKSDDDLIVAEVEFRKATEGDPQLADAWYNLGLLYAKLKKYPDAAAAYRKYLAISPAAPNAKQIEDEITRLQYFQERQPEQPKPGWTFLAKKTSGDRLGDAVYVDLSTIKIQQGISSVMILHDFATPPAGGWDFNSTKEMHEINCASKQGRRVSMASYEERMGKGKLLYQSAPPNQPFYSGDAPGSLGKLLIDAVCR